MKKILALILAFAMLASILVACNEGTQSGNASSTTDGNGSTTDKPIWTYTSVDGTDPDPDPECNEHKDANNDLVCDNCNAKLENPDDPFNKPDDTDVPVSGSIDVRLTGYSFETIFCEWTPLEGADHYNVYCDGEKVDTELIRNYGVMSLLIYYVLLRPFFSLAKYVNKDESVIVFILSYIIYLIVAGTNPLLFSSTGMLVVITMYSYVGQVKRRAVEALN
jgi:hypothetical protein